MIQKANVRNCSRIINLVTNSPAETHWLGSKLAEWVPVPGVILLQGALGTGKTTLTRGIAQGLGLDDPSLVSSPSFALVNIYEGHCRIYHVDLYRLAGERDYYTTGMGDFLGVDGVTIVEWGDRLLFPVEAPLRVEMTDGGNDLRTVRIFCGQGLAISASRLASKLEASGRLKKLSRADLS
jgi:tRNA threonylcarbamoyladenosine biosynthesis protein TsaE